MNKDLKKLTFSAFLITLTFILTRYFSIPTLIGGHINVGDSMVLLSGLIMGPVYGAIAAAIGSALADLFSPFAIYTLATFIIKGLVAVTVANLFITLKKFNLKLKIIISSIIAEIIMVVGYFVFEAFVLEFGVIVAGYEIINNLIQAGVSVILATIIYIPLRKSNIIKSMHNKTH